MIILIHVIIALSSMLFTTHLYIFPTNNKFKTAYALVAATLVSGTYLVVSTGSSILQGCMSGLFYLATVSFGIAVARRKYAHQKAKDL